MYEHAIHTPRARQLVSDGGPIRWARPAGLRGLRRPRAEPSPDPGGHRPRLPQDGPEWRRKVVTVCKRHALASYVAIVTSLTLLVLVLQIFAGVHR
jgi:hypothetical protein